MEQFRALLQEPKMPNTNRDPDLTDIA